MPLVDELRRSLATDEGHPLYLGLANALAEAIGAGRQLAPGDRLPTHRHLATELEVARGTVRRAYDELERRGIVESTVGRGTFVRESTASFGPPPADASRAGLVDLTVNLARSGGQSNAAEHLTALARQSDDALEAYVDPARDARVRRAGQRWLALHGVEATPDAVSLCVGAQHALLVAVLATTRAGDTIAVDALTYPGIRQLAVATDRRLVAVAMDEQGMIPDDLARVCRRAKPKLLYLMPTLHNPTGVTQGARRRRQLASEIANRSTRQPLWVLEDESLRLLHRDSPPPLSALLPEQTIFVAGFSKVVVAGPRIAFLHAPPALRDAVRDALWATVITPPSVSALLAARLVESGDAERAADEQRAILRHRTARARVCLGKLSSHVRDCSPYIWLPLGDLDADAVAAEALRRGVSALTGRPFAVQPPAPNALRLSIGAQVGDDALERALRVLAEVIAERGAPPAASLRLL